jgi:AraC family transcriptional regulator
MLKAQPLSIDFKEESTLLKVLPHPPLLVSSDQDQSHIHFEYHRQPLHATPTHVSHQHILCTYVGRSTLVERTLGELSRRERLTVGDTFMIPAHVVHQSTWEHEIEFMIFSLEPEFVAQVAYEAVDGPLEILPHFAKPDPLVYQIGMALKAEFELNHSGNRFYIDAMATALAAHVLQHYSSHKQMLPEPVKGLPAYKLSEAIAYIQDHLDKELSLTEIAAEVKMSPYYFARLFKQSMGIAPYQYLIQQRVERAKRLLKQRNDAIVDVALQCGFANQSHFTKLFRQLTGMTPKAYQDCH